MCLKLQDMKIRKQKFFFHVFAFNSAEMALFRDASVGKAGKILKKEGKEQVHILHRLKELNHDPDPLLITK